MTRNEFVVAIDVKGGEPRYPKYAESQENGPGQELIRLTRELYTAVWNGDGEQQAALIEHLSKTCFD